MLADKQIKNIKLETRKNEFMPRWQKQKEATTIKKKCKPQKQKTETKRCKKSSMLC